MNNTIAILILFIISFYLMLSSIYFLIRNRKVFNYRKKIIDFTFESESKGYRSMSDYERISLKQKWLENEIPSYEKMLYSMKSLNSLIKGTYKKEFLEYYKNNK